MARRRGQRSEGVILHKTVMPALRPWAEELNVKMPVALPNSNHEGAAEELLK